MKILRVQYIIVYISYCMLCTYMKILLIYYNIGLSVHAAFLFESCVQSTQERTTPSNSKLPGEKWINFGVDLNN